MHSLLRMITRDDLGLNAEPLNLLIKKRDTFAIIYHIMKSICKKEGLKLGLKQKSKG